MNILIATSSFILSGGGIASYARDFCTALKEIHNITVVTADNYANSSWNGIEVINFPVLSKNKKDAKNLLKLIEDLTPDLIVNSNAPLISLVVPYINDKIKAISISHFVNGMFADIAGFNTKYIDAVISLSNHGSQYITKTFGRKFIHKTHTVYNFIPPDLNGPIKKEKHSNDIIKIVYPGGGAPAKSPDVVYEVLRLLLKSQLDFRFYWIGNTTLPAASFFKIKNIEELLPNDNRIIFTGMIPREEAISNIRSANIFLLPSRGEGCPISLMEAMSAGVVPIVSDSPHASVEIIKHGINGYVFSTKSPKEIAKCIIEIILDHDKFIYIYHNSFETARSLLSSDEWKIKMDKVFQKECEHKRRKNFSILSFFFKRYMLEGKYYKNRIKTLIRNLKIRSFFTSVSLIRNGQI